MGPLQASFADELRRLRTAVGNPSYATLASRSGVPKSTISDLLNGRFVNAPSWDTVRLVVQACVAESIRDEHGNVTPDVADRGSVTWWRRRHGELLEALEANRSSSIFSGEPTESVALGRVIGELDDADALGLEVHQAIRISQLDSAGDVAVLPPYLERAHDGRVREELALAERGNSRVVMLVGGSSTGKTRTCWEAIRAVLPHWRIWHPLTPERPHAILGALSHGQIRPRTVIWLNEAQMYLQPAEIGEKVASALQHLLTQSGTGPVVVLGSMWPDYFTELTDPSSSMTHQAARVLLQGRDIAVPSRFTPDDLSRWETRIAADTRLQLAVELGGERVTQQLAGVPELLQRHERADDCVQAVVAAAVDALRLSRWRHLPREFLRRAAPGYLSEQVWDLVDDSDWFERAITYLTQPCRGAPGPLTRLKSGAAYRLHDYLEQSLGQERARCCPPATFWTAAASTCADPHVLADLGYAARDRGRLHRAHQLFQRAVDHGNNGMLQELARLRWQAMDYVGAERFARAAIGFGDLRPVLELARRLGPDGGHLLDEDLVRHAVSRGDTEPLMVLAEIRAEAGDQAGAERFARQAADLGDTLPVQMLTRLRAESGGLAEETDLLSFFDARKQPPDLKVLADYEKAGDHVNADHFVRNAAHRGDTKPLSMLAELRDESGDLAGAERAACQAADHGDWTVLQELVRRRGMAGHHADAERLARQAAARGHTKPLKILALLRERDGDPARAERFAHLAADHGDTTALAALAEDRELADDHAGAEDLASQAAARGDTRILPKLAFLRADMGDQARAEELACQAADRGETAVLCDLSWQRQMADDPAGAERLAYYAADRGDGGALYSLAALRLRTGDYAEAERFAIHAATRGDTSVLTSCAEWHEETGDHVAAQNLWRQAADLGDIEALQALARQQEQAGDHREAERLAVEAAERGDNAVLLELAESRDDAGDHSRAEQLARQAADNGDAVMLQILVERRVEAGDLAVAERLARYAADCGDTHILWDLAFLSEEAGDHVEAERIARRAASHGHAEAAQYLAGIREAAGDDAKAADLLQVAVNCGNEHALKSLVELRDKAGDHVEAERLACQAVPGYVAAMKALAERREKAGDQAAAERLANQCAYYRNHEHTLTMLVRLRENAGDHIGVERLWRQSADRGNRSALETVVRLREQAGNHDEAEQLSRYGFTDDGQAPAAPW